MKCTSRFSDFFSTATPRKIKKVSKTIENGCFFGADYQNGSTPENIYSATDLSDKIGSLDPYEKCKCLAKYKGRYLVCYKVNGKNTYKTGFVKYHGKVD